MRMGDTTNGLNSSPCHKCAERSVGCHGTCETYRTWSAKRDEAKMARRKYEEAVDFTIRGLLKGRHEKERTSR